MAATVLTSRKATPLALTRENTRQWLRSDVYGLAGWLGYADMTPTFHRPMSDFIQGSSYLRNLYMVPRGFFKTSLFIAKNIQRVLNRQDIRILLASNKAENAEAVLAEIKGHLLNDELIWLFPEILFKDPAKQSDVWTTSRIAVKTTKRRREPTITTIGLHGELTGRHYDHGTFDDLVGLENSQTREERLKTIAWWQAAQSLLDPGSTEDIVGCLPADAEVLMEDGTTKSIALVKPGDMVWAADEDGSLTPRAVKAMVPQGLAETVTITTSAKTLRATPNHPFLVHQEKGLHLYWARADALKPGDYVVSIKEIPGVLEHPWMTEDFVWLFGFLLGDGWASVYDGPRQRAHVGIALSKDEALNARVLGCAAEWLPGPWDRTPLGYARNDRRQNAVGLQALGLVGTAKTKRLPEWAFRLPPAYRRALLKGFCEADGHRLNDGRSIDAWRVEIANRGLLEDLRHLASLCGVRTGTMRTRRRIIKAPNSTTAVVSETCDCGFNFAAVERREVYHLSPRVQISPGLRQERVVSVDMIPVLEPVYDLTVEGTPSFFANGLAVHNTPWDWDDLYAWLLMQKAKHGMPLGVYKRSCWESCEPGTPGAADIPGKGWVCSTFPERFPVKELVRIKKEIGSIRYSAQYDLDPVDEETAVFPRSQAVIWPRHKMPDTTGMWLVMSVDPAESQKGWADYTAFAVVGFDHENRMFVYHLDRGRWTETQVIREVYAWFNRYRGVTSIGIEAIAFQKYLLHLFTAEGEKRHQFLPIFKLARDTKRTKTDRIRVLQPFWESGHIILADDLPMLDEFLSEAARFRLYKESTHDDMLDALADCFQLRVQPPSVDPHPERRALPPEDAERLEFEERLVQTRQEAKMPALDTGSLRMAWAMRQDAAEREQQTHVVSAYEETWR